MIQHVLIAISGVLIGYPLVKNGKITRSRNSPKLAVFGIIGIATSLILWHLPYFWDLAVELLYVHMIEHSCFLIVGVLIGICPIVTSQFQDGRGCPRYFGRCDLAHFGERSAKYDNRNGPTRI
jgi:hypothetical protein